MSYAGRRTRLVQCHEAGSPLEGDLEKRWCCSAVMISSEKTVARLRQDRFRPQL
jgi:hypothetical protein